MSDCKARFGHESSSQSSGDEWKKLRENRRSLLTGQGEDDFHIRNMKIERVVESFRVWSMTRGWDQRNSSIDLMIRGSPAVGGERGSAVSAAN